MLFAFGGHQLMVTRLKAIVLEKCYSSAYCNTASQMPNSQGEKDMEKTLTLQVAFVLSI